MEKCSGNDRLIRMGFASRRESINDVVEKKCPFFCWVDHIWGQHPKAPGSLEILFCNDHPVKAHLHLPSPPTSSPPLRSSTSLRQNSIASDPSSRISQLKDGKMVKSKAKRLLEDVSIIWKAKACRRCIRATKSWDEVATRGVQDRQNAAGYGLFQYSEACWNFLFKLGWSKVHLNMVLSEVPSYLVPSTEG